jgi:alkanesulfonate monooxygenase SsuD/methylene tetrahydromethanopterin reductase-like flavin-dependent oxidoreductase (luciferase family)
MATSSGDRPYRGARADFVRHALYVPPFGDLADPRVLVDLAVAAEETGWDGFFLWDHLLRPEREPQELADAWTVLAAVAASTSRIRIGPMVTPLTRRRPQKLAREVVTLDHLSGGRLTVGLGLGVDDAGELSRFGEESQPSRRGAMLDEGVELLTALLSGSAVRHHGPYYRADDVRFLPTPIQRPVPVWFGARPGRRRPLERAARYQGVFPLTADAGGLTRALSIVEAVRGDLAGFDVAVVAIPGIDIAGLAAAGATWAMWTFLPGSTRTDVSEFIGRRRDG